MIYSIAIELNTVIFPSALFVGVLFQRSTPLLPAQFKDDNYLRESTIQKASKCWQRRRLLILFPFRGEEVWKKY